MSENQRTTCSQSPAVITPAHQESVAARLFEAFNNRDLDGALGLVHPDIVFLPVTALVLKGGKPYRGYEGIRRYVADLEAHLDELIVYPLQIRSAGRAVVALGKVSGRGPMGSFDGVSTTWVFKFKDGLVSHAQIFSDPSSAQQALGSQ